MERIIWRDATVNGNTTEVKEDKYGRKNEMERWHVTEALEGKNLLETR